MGRLERNLQEPVPSLPTGTNNFLTREETLMTLANSFFRLAALAMGLSLVATTVTAAPFLSINFDSQNLGDPVATSFPGVPPYPITEAYATGGFPDTPPYSGTNTVASPAG